VRDTVREAGKGHLFRLDEDIKAMMLQWFQQQYREFSVEVTTYWLMSQ
jgi:hypothetical protein